VIAEDHVVEVGTVVEVVVVVNIGVVVEGDRQALNQAISGLITLTGVEGYMFYGFVL
jgi:transposase-like protein